MDPNSDKEETSTVDTLSSGIKERHRHIFALLMIISAVLFLVGGLIVVMTTGQYYLYFLGFMIVFSLIETNTFSRRVQNHLPFHVIWPAILAAFAMGFVVALGVLWAELWLLSAVAPVSILTFIIANLFLVFMSDFAHSLMSYEFTKHLLRVRVDDHLKENLLIAKGIHPGKQAVISALRSLLTTTIILIALVFVLTLAVTKAVVPQFDVFADIPEDQLQIPIPEMSDYMQSLPIVRELADQYTVWNEELLDGRQKVLANRDKIKDSMLENMWLLLQGDLFSTIADAQQFGAGINARFYSINTDLSAFRYASKHVLLPRNSREQFYASKEQLADLKKEVDAQHVLFEENKDKKFGVRLPVDIIKTDLGEIDLNDILPSTEKDDKSVLEGLYLGLFESTTFYQDSQRVLQSLQSTILLEKERIEKLHASLDTEETDQSRYFRLHLLFQHLVNFNIEYCNSLGDCLSECLETAKLINPTYCELVEDEAAYIVCVAG